MSDWPIITPNNAGGISTDFARPPLMLGTSTSTDRLTLNMTLTQCMIQNIYIISLEYDVIHPDHPSERNYGSSKNSKTWSATASNGEYDELLCCLTIVIILPAIGLHVFNNISYWLVCDHGTIKQSEVIMAFGCTIITIRCNHGVLD